MYPTVISSPPTTRFVQERPAQPDAPPEPSSARDEHWSVPELRARGWTEAMVQRILGEPDQRIVNPYYRTAAPMRLYRAARVVAAEATPAFAERAAKAAARSARGKAIAQAKAQALLQHVAEMPVTVRVVEPEVLQRRAVAHYNQRQQRRAGTSFTEWVWDGEPATPDSDPAFLARITVNFVRHQWTTYDRRLEEVAGQIGVERAIAAIRQRIFAAIAEAYPHLAPECVRQLAARGQTVMFRVSNQG